MKSKSTPEPVVSLWHSFVIAPRDLVPQGRLNLGCQVAGGDMEESAVTRRRLPSCPGCGRTVVRGHPDHDGTACEECCSICAEDVGWLSGWLVPSPRAVEWGT